MNISTSRRLEGIGEYYFSKKLRELEEMNKNGGDVINLGIGSPDLPPHHDVIRELHMESNKPNVHGYQNYKGSPILRKAMAEWYRTWYNVELDADSEILPLIGSKEGIVHICMTYLDHGDEVLIPDPGYPTYQSAVKLAGGSCRSYHLTEGNHWFPDFDALEKTDLSKVKLMWVNYPHMPTGALPTTVLFERLVAFGKKNNILICHDNPYSFILNEHPMSLLSVEGAKDVVLELNSLSKAQNMAGWRVGLLCGAKERIAEVLTFKSNMDSGMFLPVQLAAAKALTLGKDWYDELNKEYKERREYVFSLLDKLNCSYDKGQSGLFVWARIPSNYEDGFAMSDDILHKAAVFITPGGIFGSEGKHYIRVSLCSKKEKLLDAMERIEEAFSSQHATINLEG
jgi:LL-diaminopimelate aminotransferase